MSKLASARKALATQRKKAKERKGALVRRGSMTVAAYGLGKQQSGGTLFGIQLPSIFGWPTATTTAALGLGASMFIGGQLGNVAEGVGDGGLAVAAYNYGRGEGVTGGTPMDAELAELEAALQQAIAQDAGA